MEEKLKEIDARIERLANKISELEFKILELKKTAPAKIKSVTTSKGVIVWEAYREAFLERYQVEPVRNAKINRQCLDISNRIGVDALNVVKFYLTLNDPQFIRMNHPLGILLMNCESIHTMWQRGAMVTRAAAFEAERRGNSMDATRSYLEKKHGKKD